MRLLRIRIIDISTKDLLKEVDKLFDTIHSDSKKLHKATKKMNPKKIETIDNVIRLAEKIRRDATTLKKIIQFLEANNNA